jgi:hypothetical protein
MVYSKLALTLASSVGQVLKKRWGENRSCFEDGSQPEAQMGITFGEKHTLENWVG